LEVVAAVVQEPAEAEVVAAAFQLQTNNLRHQHNQNIHTDEQFDAAFVEHPSVAWERLGLLNCFGFLEMMKMQIAWALVLWQAMPVAAVLFGRQYLLEFRTWIQSLIQSHCRFLVQNSQIVGSILHHSQLRLILAALAAHSQAIDFALY
jgi:hypothetical protein